MNFNADGLAGGLTRGVDGDSQSGDSSCSTNDDSSRNASSLGGDHVNHDGSSTSSFSLARDDSTKVFRAKIIVFCVICLCAIGCSTFAFVYTRSQENKAFEHEVSIEYATFCAIHIMEINTKLTLFVQHTQTSSVS